MAGWTLLLRKTDNDNTLQRRWVPLEKIGERMSSTAKVYRDEPHACTSIDKFGFSKYFIQLNTHINIIRYMYSNFNLQVSKWFGMILKKPPENCVDTVLPTVGNVI